MVHRRQRKPPQPLAGERPKPLPDGPTHCACGTWLEPLRRTAGYCKPCVAARFTLAEFAKGHSFDPDSPQWVETCTVCRNGFTRSTFGGRGVCGDCWRLNGLGEGAAATQEATVQGRNHMEWPLVCAPETADGDDGEREQKPKPAKKKGGGAE